MLLLVVVMLLLAALLAQLLLLLLLLLGTSEVSHCCGWRSGDWAWIFVVYVW